MGRPGRDRQHGRVREAAAAGYATPEQLKGVLLDSDVVIEILRGNRDVIAEAVWLENAGISSYCCAITLAEIFAGVRPGEEALTREFFRSRGEVRLDAAVGETAGGYLATYRDSHGVELADALIVAAATRSGLRLWTRNRRHYPMAELTLYEP